MFRSKRSVAYFAHDPSHRLLLAPDAADDDDDGEFTCDGCQVVGAGPRYTCGHPGCGFKLHEACARRFPRTLKSIVHPKHRLKRRESAGGRCEVCGEDVKGACYVCDAAACASATVVVVHPLCVRLPPVARGSAAAHPGGHDAWLVKNAPDGGAAASTCAACGLSIDGPWRYRCGTCRVDVHPRCLVPALDQCRRGEASEVAMGKRCCLSTGREVIGCLNISYYYRGAI